MISCTARLKPYKVKPVYKEGKETLKMVFCRGWYLNKTLTWTRCMNFHLFTEFLSLFINYCNRQSLSLGCKYISKYIRKTVTMKQIRE